MGEKGEAVEESGRETKRLQLRIQDLESLQATTDGKTLKEAEQIFLQAKEIEIVDIAKVRSNETIDSWKRNEMPEIVRTEAIKVLTEIIVGLNMPQHQDLPEELLKSGLPGKIEGIMKDQVIKKVNDEFRKRVEAGSTKLASTKLESLVMVEWPKFLAVNVIPRSAALAEMVATNFSKFITGTFPITCDKCGLDEHINLRADDIEVLMRKGWINFWCSDENCKDLIGRHQIKVTMVDLISFALVQGGSNVK